MPKKTATDKWIDLLTKPHHTYFSWLPSAPRCSICGIPFGGIGGGLAHALGYRRWHNNPTLCNMCYRGLPGDGAEVDVAILFADMRGSTVLGEQVGPTAFAELLNHFYRVAIEVLTPNRAIIDKLIGDEVMAFFARMAGPNYRHDAVAAAKELMRRFPEVIPTTGAPRLGIGLNAGIPYVGKVGEGTVNDFTAPGDTINTTARVRQEANPGELIMSAALYQTVVANYEGLESRILHLRGRQEQMAVRVMKFMDSPTQSAP